MELLNTSDPASAVAEFEALLSRNPDYAAAYFHGGQASEKLGDVEKARAFYEKGIAVTTRNGDRHTRSEIEAALDLLPI
jgi:Tfp pilus assembly protein PilF